MTSLIDVTPGVKNYSWVTSESRETSKEEKFEEKTNGQKDKRIEKQQVATKTIFERNFVFEEEFLRSSISRMFSKQKEVLTF